MLSCVSLRILLITIFTSISTLQGSSFVYLGWLLYQVSEGLSVMFWPVCITYWRRLRQWWTHRKWGWKGSCIAQGAQLGALCWPGGVKWARSEGRFKGEGISVYIRLIPFVVQQKPTQHCQAIILQFFFFKGVFSPGGWLRKVWWDSNNSQCVSGCTGITWPESLSKLWDYFLRFYGIY